MKVLIYGTDGVNNRVCYVYKALQEISTVKILRGGVKTKVGKLVNIMLYICNALWADIIYFAPFSHCETRLISIAHLLKRKIVIDYYASYYDMLVLDKKYYDMDTQQANNLLKIDRYALGMVHIPVKRRRFSATDGVSLPH